MLMHHEIRNGAGVHPFQFVDTGRIAAENAVHQRAGFVFTQRADEHLANVFRCTNRDARLPRNGIEKRIEHDRNLAHVDAAQAGHRRADALHLARVEMLEHARRIVFAQRQQQHRGAIDALHLFARVFLRRFGYGCAVDSGFTHLLKPSV